MVGFTPLTVTLLIWRRWHGPSEFFVISSSLDACRDPATLSDGIGTLGEVFYATPKPADVGAENRESFRRFCVKLDQRLGRQPPLAFRTAFAERWGVDCPQSVAVILYTYFRNSLVHGYYGRTVFVTGDGTNSLHLRDDGCVLVHPRWLLERFLEVAEEHVAEVLVAPSQSSLRRNALNYVRGLPSPTQSPFAQTATAPVITRTAAPS